MSEAQSLNLRDTTWHLLVTGHHAGHHTTEPPWIPIGGLEIQDTVLSTYFDMKLQIFVHGVDVIKDVLHYPGDDAHCVCVMEVPLQTDKKKIPPKMEFDISLLFIMFSFFSP